MYFFSPLLVYFLKGVSHSAEEMQVHFLVFFLQLSALCLAKVLSENENMDENCFEESFPSIPKLKTTDDFVYIKIVHISAEASDVSFHGCKASRVIDTQYYNISKNEKLIVDFDTSTTFRNVSILFDGQSVMAAMGFYNLTENFINRSLDNDDWSCVYTTLNDVDITETMVFHLNKIQTKLGWLAHTEELEVTIVSEIPEESLSTAATASTTSAGNLARLDKSVSLFSKVILILTLNQLLMKNL